jgi:hypothetical protein
VAEEAPEGEEAGGQGQRGGVAEEAEGGLHQSKAYRKIVGFTGAVPQQAGLSGCGDWGVGIAAL